MALMAALETLNYKIFGAKNGLEALRMLKNHPEIVLVLSDVITLPTFPETPPQLKEILVFAVKKGFCSLSMDTKESSR